MARTPAAPAALDKPAGNGKAGAGAGFSPNFLIALSFSADLSAVFIIPCLAAYTQVRSGYFLRKKALFLFKMQRADMAALTTDTRIIGTIYPSAAEPVPGLFSSRSFSLPWVLSEAAESLSAELLSWEEISDAFSGSLSDRSSWEPGVYVESGTSEESGASEESGVSEVSGVSGSSAPLT